MGMAEPFYVHAHLKRRFRTVLFPSLPRRAPWRFLPPFLAYNLWSLIQLRKIIRMSPFHLLYAYKSALTVPAFLHWRDATPWVYDLRTHPVRQIPRKGTHASLKGLLLALYDRVKKKANAFALHRCDLVVTVSEALKEQLISQFGIPDHKIHVMPLGVDHRLFRRDRPPPSAPPGPLNVVYVSSVALYRGHQTCIEAAKILKEKGIPFRMEFIGSGPRSAIERLEALTKERGVSGEVIWRGFLPHEQIPRALQDAHVGLSPLPDIEAYRVSSPTKVLEYMAMGLAVVASHIRAHREVLENGQTALLFRPDDPEDLADRLQRLYADPKMRERLAEAASQASQAYDWEKLLGELEKKIEFLLSRAEKPRQ